ncbi:MAG: membrane integrity-associated transporter subunit PqiC, partial [Proteobacteria bacterium]|nr:membrane integrity-associated transporter subunit PqiC [Pseudomonadota bacterium]
VATAGFVLASCGGLNIGPPPAGQLYVLRPATTPPTDAPAAQWQLAIALPDAPDSLDTNRIALIRSQSVMDYYANSAWVDHTTQLVQSLLVEAFEKSGKITAVARETEGLRSDYILQTDIRDFEAQYDVQDGIPHVTVRISARLLNIPQRNVISIITVDHEASASANSVPAVVAAFNTATGAALNEIVSWALKAPALPQANVDQIGADKAEKPVSHRRRGHRHRRR